MKEYYLTFDYDARGRGELQVHNDSLIPWRNAARCGSVDKTGALVNATPSAVWAIIDRPVVTYEPPMCIGGEGWKVRLWSQLGGSKKWEYTHYLIHPDGNLPGSKGCIVLPGIFQDFVKMIHQILDKQPRILVYVNTERKDA